jgi:hypothetical protein
MLTGGRKQDETINHRLYDVVLCLRDWLAGRWRPVFCMRWSPLCVCLINCCWRLFRSAKYSRRTDGGALWSGADGPRPEAERSATWRRGWGFPPWGRTVRACAGAAEDHRRRLDPAPRRDPVGEERSYGLFRLGPADLDSSNRRRVEERRRIWGSRG